MYTKYMSNSFDLPNDTDSLWSVLCIRHPYGMTECENESSMIETGSLWEHAMVGILHINNMLDRHIRRTHNRFYFIAFVLCVVIVWEIAYITAPTTSTTFLPAVAGIQ